MALSEIEKLERRYAENPQGLTFAPLAEVHRKNGDVPRALELLGPGLQQHPNYVPASIVLGRCHLDLGDLAAAETAFTHVLELDGENVIALKALADIGERQHHYDRAEAWLQTLLSVDRTNDEARSQLERIEAARAMATQATASSDEPTLEALVVPGLEPAEPSAAADDSAADAVPVLDEVSPQPDHAAPTPIGYEDLEYSALDAEAEELPPAGLEVDAEEVVRPAEPVEPIPGLIGRDLNEPAGDEFTLETSEDIVLQSAGGSEFQMPDAIEELSTPARGASEPEPFPEPEPVAEPERELEPEPEWQSDVIPERFDAGVAEAEPELEPEDEPPAVEPAEQRPARRALTASETGGESVGSFFGRLLASRPPAAPTTAAAHVPPPPGAGAADTGGAPTRPAADALSLSSVFGEEASSLPPAVPAAGPAASGVSFDEFYGASGGASGSRAPKSAETKNDDLDQFHAWLQNLKR